MIPSQIIESILKKPRGYGGKNDIQFRQDLVVYLNDYGTPAVDAIGNIWLTIGKPNNVLIVGHTDTVDNKLVVRDKPLLSTSEGILSLDIEKINTWPREERPYCLGADDGAGIALMLCLIASSKEATYLFTIGEEVGCVGAKWVVKNTPELLEPFDFCLEVDRKGITEIITDQSPGMCASDEFSLALADQLGMDHSPSPNGIYTDNAEFSGLISECVNIAAGYYNQHHLEETQDLLYLDELFLNMLELKFNDFEAFREAGDFGSWQGFGEMGDYSYGSYGTPPGMKPARYKAILEYISDCPDEIYELMLESGIDLDDYIY